MKTVLIGAVAGLMMAVGIAGTALADPSPNGPGQPGAPATTCQQFTTMPGNASNANSPFNPNGNAGANYAGNPGTASLLHSNSTHAVSQYDIACFQQTQHQH
jgi:hypothetical protein